VPSAHRVASLLADRIYGDEMNLMNHSYKNHPSLHVLKTASDDYSAWPVSLANLRLWSISAYRTTRSPGISMWNR
jgi:hypothetical protein